MKRRILAILLAAIMVLSAVPFSVFAEEATVACPGKGKIHTLDNCDSEKFADVAPVCNKPGYSVYTCLNPDCGDQFVVITKEASNTPHTIVKATKAATCTETGIKEDRWQCIACKDYFTDANGKNVTTDYETPALGHDHQAVEGDCSIVKCSRCGHTQQAPINSDPNNGPVHDGAHNYKVIKFHTPAATCKDTAKADVKCTVCGFEKKNVDVASDVPHDFKDAVTKKDPTCTDKGYKAHKQCKVCNRYFALDGVTELFANPTTDAQKANALYIAALGHSAKRYLISEKPATCTTPGSRTYRCDRDGCGEFIENEVIPANPEKGYWIYNKDTNKYVTVDGTANGAKLIVKKTGTNTYAVWYGDKDLDYPTAKNGTLGAKQEFRDANIVLHKFSVAKKNPTCIEYGYTKKVCVLCGTEETVDIKEPTKHLKADGTVNGTYSSTPVKPTCTTAGVDIYKCNVCSTDVAVKVNAWGHSAEKTVTTANCQSAGVTFTYVTAPANAPDGWTCTCDTYEAVTGPVEFLNEDGTPKAKYYLWDPDTVKAGADGAFLGETFFVKGGEKGITEAAKDASKHVIRTQVVNEPTCTTAGNGFKFCFVKGCTFEPVTYTISALGHKFELTWAKGTAADKKTLTNSEEYKSMSGHVMAKTCTTNTYFAVKCKNKGCDAESAAGQKVSGLSTDLKNDKLGHNVVTEEFYVICDGKTLNNGLAATKGYKITYCKNEACNTKTAKNNDKQKCGYVISVVETAAYAEKLSYTKDEVENYHKDLLSSTKSGVYKVGSCTEVGYDWYYCEDCDKNILVVKGDTGSHLKPAVDDRNASNYKAQQNATCCVDGTTEWYVCQRCDAKVGGTPITKDCHYVLVIAGKEASCNPDGTITYGYKAIYTCDADNCCNHTDKTRNEQKFFEYTVVDTDADGKDVYGYVQLAGITRAMVYVKNGSTYTNTLKNANVLANMALDKVTKTINDNKASNVFAADNVRLGDEINSGKIHNFENKDGKAANCTEDGYSAYQQCKECGYIYGKKPIKAPVHDFDDKEDYAATCLDYGYSVATCKICDYVIVTNFVAPLGHDLAGVAEETVNATCTQPGYKYKTCKRAGCVEPRVLTSAITYVPHKNAAGKELGIIDKVDFEKAIKTGVEVKNTITTICTEGMTDKDRTCVCGLVFDEGHIEKATPIAPTCTTAGYTVVICAGCNEVLEEKTEVDTLPALNHVYPKGHANEGKEAWKLTKTDAATETATGTKYFECQLCKATKTEVIPPVSTIYLDLTYANANGKEGFAEYSLITVNVLLSSKKAAIRTLSYELNYDKAKLEFVSAKLDNTFAIAEINPDKTNGVVKFAGMSPNAVEVGESAVIATITFRAIAAGTTESFEFANAEAYLEAGAKVEVNKDIDNADTKDVDESKITIATLMDVYTKDTVPGTVDMQDALAIYDLMTNSEYNVAADLDKDGEITANDLQLFYSIFVGTMKKEALRNYEVN